MTTNEQLYGEGVNVPPIPESLANQRIKLLKENLSKLLEPHYMNQDNSRIREVEKAINFWDKLRNGEGI